MYSAAFDLLAKRATMDLHKSVGLSGRKIKKAVLVKYTKKGKERK